MRNVIEAENLSKAYRLGQFNTGALSKDIQRWWYSVRGKEDPYLKIGQANNRTLPAESLMVWSLLDLNFNIEQGSAVGIIGRNGAGKSTLLKLLSRVTSPTKGTIRIKGRVASLLEVGTGFHPELTGRENIFLNGAILGMRKAEISRRFEEIVEFAGVARYVDTPVKRYSSGMYVRLAFAVAAHLESEILIVDEVLAVGDMEFQKKCVGKMENASKEQGRTVLFVSHNMQSIRSLCSTGILLDNGKLVEHSSVNETIESYQQLFQSSSGIPVLERTDRRGTGEVRLIDIVLNENQGANVIMGESLKVQLTLNGKAEKLVISVDIGNLRLNPILRAHTEETLPRSKVISIDGTKKMEVTFENLPLNYGEYDITVWVGVRKERDELSMTDLVERAATFEVLHKDVFGSGSMLQKSLTVFSHVAWDFEE